DPFFRGRLAPFCGASDSPIAIACLRFFTLPPCPYFPLRSVPCFLRRIALSTLLVAAEPYFRRPFRRWLFMLQFLSEAAGVMRTPCPARGRLLGRSVAMRARE